MGESGATSRVIIRVSFGVTGRLSGGARGLWVALVDRVAQGCSGEPRVSSRGLWIPESVLVLPLGFKRRLSEHRRVPQEASRASERKLGVTGSLSRGHL